MNNTFNKFITWFLDDSSRNKKSLIDTEILYSALILIAIGIVFVYSASIAYAVRDTNAHSQYYYLIRHIFYILVGLLASIGIFNVPTTTLKKYAFHISIVIVVLLIGVLIPHVGRVVNGSRRWIGFGIVNVQPSELAKLGMAIYLSHYVCSKTEGLKNFLNDIIPIFLIIGLVDGLLLLEPDMGSATVVFIIALGVLYMANLDKKIIIGFSSIGVIGFVVLILIAPYRMRRVLGFINPWQDALGKGYQLTHSLLAVGHGGWFGVGLGNSIEKLFYLPEAHTDFILAIIAEETGVLGVCVVLMLFWVIFYRGFAIVGVQASKLPGRKFQGLLAQGISLWFFAQTVVNVGVAVGALPTKGLTLPFISFGGSSIVVSCIALAILLKIDYENRQLKRGIEID